MKRILFLDIDGVLNSAKSCCAYGGYPMRLEDPAFDQIAIKLLQRFCDSSGVQVVLSSSWRILYKWQDVGKALALPIIDATPSMSGHRGAEIARWLSEHDDVEQYAIIDDDGDMLDSQLSRFVHTDGYEGFTWRDYCKLCEIFGENPWSGEVRDKEWVFREPSKIKLGWEAG